MGSLSTVEPATKLELHELLSRWCWAIDHHDVEEWGNLFTVDAQFSLPDGTELNGRDAILSVPDRQRERGGGNWRHHFTNIIVDRGPVGRELKVRAFLTIRDCADAAPVASADCVILARRTDHWRIATFEATSVCKGGALPRPEPEAKTAALH